MRSLIRNPTALGALLALSALLASCGGDGGALPLPSTTYSISGAVTGGTGAVSGVSLTLAGTRSAVAVTGTNGAYSFNSLPAGTYTVTAVKAASEFTPASRVVSISSSNATGVDFLLLQGDAFEGAGDDSAATASTIALDTDQVRTLYPDGDVDWVKVTLTEAGGYEFSANRLGNASDVVMSLYACAGLGTALVDGLSDPGVDDYIGLDSRIYFNITVPGDYCLEIRSGGWSKSVTENGIATYTLNIHAFVDGDNDTFSTYYDCNDSGDTIGPRSPECSGITRLDAAAEDPVDVAGDDSSRANAKPMTASSGDGWELQLRSELDANARTLYPAGDVDYFSIIVPPNSAVLVHAAITGMTGSAVYAEAFNSSGMPVVGPALLSQNTIDPASGNLFITNVTADAAVFTVRFSGVTDTDTGYYVPFYYSIGLDADADDFYSNDWPGYRDCDDSNASINPGTAETPDDLVDSNCNGDDNA